MNTRTQRICFLFLPLLVFGLFLGVRHFVTKRHIRLLETKYEALKAGWRTNSFLSSSDAVALATEIRARLEDQAVPLEGAKADALADTLSRMFAAYSSGSSEAFAAFRFPVPDFDTNEFGWNEDWVGFEKEALGLHGIKINPTGDRDRDNVEVSKQFYNWAIGLTNELGQKRYCTTCWSAMALESLLVTPVETTTDRIDLAKLAQKEGSINLTTVIFSAYHSASGVIKNEKKALFCLTRFVVKTKGKLEAYKVYISFFWHPRYSQWIPRQMVIPTSTMDMEKLLF